jgi:hypothetical protein
VFSTNGFDSQGARAYDPPAIIIETTAYQAVVF